MADLNLIYRRLRGHFGIQCWWPAETDFEVAVGAILTQRTAWINVEKAIDNLREHDLLDPQGILSATDNFLQALLIPCGFYRQKAEYLRSFCELLEENSHGKLNDLGRLSLKEARNVLLAVKGIGNETADSILLYACNMPTFVIDAYTRRIIARLEGKTESSYGSLKEWFELEIGRDVHTYQQYHALLVELGKNYCKTKPSCEECPLRDGCEHTKID